MTAAFDIAPARKVRQRVKVKLAPDPVFSPAEGEVEFWDRITSPLLALLEDEHEGLDWQGIAAAAELAGIKERFVTDAVAYLHNMARIHPGDGEVPRWFYGPAPGEP